MAQARVRGRTLQERRALFFQINPLCEPCKANGRITPAEQLDHIKALCNGGSDDPDNWQSICRPCHLEKTARDLGYQVRRTTGTDGWPI